MTSGSETEKPLPPPVTKAAALSYRPEEDGAPRVVASGRGEIAQRILALAREAGVPIREDAGLVEALLRVDLAGEIPPELYPAVAEVLAFVWRADRSKSG